MVANRTSCASSPAILIMPHQRPEAMPSGQSSHAVGTSLSFSQAASGQQAGYIRVATDPRAVAAGQQGQRRRELSAEIATVSVPGSTKR